jgi:hypothetical protein
MKITLKIIISVVLLSICKLSAQTYQTHIFKTVPFGGGGCSTGIITCPTQKDLIFVRTDMGGAFRWVEAEKGWKSLHFAAPKPGLLCTESMAVDPNSPNKVYIVTGEVYFDGGATTLMRSSDYGDTWEYIDLTSFFRASSNAGGQKGSGERLMIDPNKSNILYYGSRNNGLWKSTDYGSTWKKVTTFPIQSNTTGNGVLFMDFLSEFTAKGQETQAIYAGISRADLVTPLDSANIYLSYDAGLNWSPISSLKGSGAITPPANYVPQHSVYAGGKIYVTYGNAPKPCLWRYDVISETWEDVSPVDNYPISGISVDNKTNPTTIALTTNAQFLYQGWVPGVNGYGDDIFRGKFDANGKITWDKRLIYNSLAKYDMNAEVVNGGMHWSWDVEIDPFNKNRIFVTSGNGIYSSENFTAPVSTWYANVHNLEQTITMDIASVPGGKFMLALGDISGGVYTDFTQKCIRFNPSQAVTNSVDYSPVTKMLIRSGSNRLANGVSGNIMTSDQDGVLWTGVAQTSIPLSPALPNPLTSKDSGPSYGCAVISADGTTIAYSFSWTVSDVKYYGTFYTRDRGVTWTALPSSYGVNTNIIADKVAPNSFYVNTGSAINYYKWNGTTYDLKSYALPSTSLSKRLRINPLVEGEFLGWAGGSGVYLFSNYGSKYTKLSIPTCNGAGWGKPAPGKTNPTIFAYGKATGETINRVYRTDDYGTNWVRITDNNSQFSGVLNRELINGDMNVYGRVYIANPGIGLVYADIQTLNAIDSPNADATNLAIIGNNSSGEGFSVITDRNLYYRFFSISGLELLNGQTFGSTTIGSELKRGTYILELNDKNTHERQINKVIK